MTDLEKPLSQLDNLVIKIAGALVIAGILWITAASYQAKTDIAVVQTELKNLLQTFDNTINKLNDRIKELEVSTRDQYTMKEAKKDAEIILLQLEGLRQRIVVLERGIK